MEDEKKTTPNNTGKETKTAKDTKEAKKPGGLQKFFSEIRGEFRKVIWASRKDLIKQTGVVIGTSIIIGAVILCFDSVFSFAYSLVVQLLG